MVMLAYFSEKMQSASQLFRISGRSRIYSQPPGPLRAGRKMIHRQIKNRIPSSTPRPSRYTPAIISTAFIAPSAAHRFSFGVRSSPSPDGARPRAACAGAGTSAAARCRSYRRSSARRPQIRPVSLIRQTGGRPHSGPAPPLAGTALPRGSGRSHTGSACGICSPSAGYAGDGIEPCSTMRSRRTVGSGIGMAENSAFVYGCSGLVKDVLRLAVLRRGCPGT